MNKEKVLHVYYLYTCTCLILRFIHVYQAFPQNFYAGRLESVFKVKLYYDCVTYIHVTISNACKISKISRWHTR